MSRTELGPKSGRLTKFPAPSPHAPSVWPKSSSCRSRPSPVDTSNRPPMPRVLLTTNRMESLHRELGLALEELVDGGAGIGEVVEEVPDAVAQSARKLEVKPGDGLQQRPVQRVVERVGLAVHGLPRVGRIACRLAGTGHGGGATGKSERGDGGDGHPPTVGREADHLDVLGSFPGTPGARSVMMLAPDPIFKGESASAGGKQTARARRTEPAPGARIRPRFTSSLPEVPRSGARSGR